jgi:hypothetical protein
MDVSVFGFVGWRLESPLRAGKGSVLVPWLTRASHPQFFSLLEGLLGFVVRLIIDGKLVVFDVVIV